LKHKCLEWACIAHLNIWNTSYGQKKGREWNWQFDSWPLKVGNWPNFQVYSQCATYRWKTLKGLQFFLKLHCNRRSARQVMHLQSCKSPRCSNLGVPGQKTIWMWSPWRATKYTIRGKVVASPKSGLWWVLWIRGCPWFILAPKLHQLCTNHPVLVLCRSVWIIEAWQFFLVPSWSSSTPLYPCKCCEPGSGSNSLLFQCFQFGIHIWVP
jgi:hypothetical protein